ncbi:MAG TPA: aldehyde dehydrogenase family protein [Pyrinomonadaceae bacterium]|jgi:aldehyde dehydrogenase
MTFFDKCLDGAALFALNQGEICTCPSRLLVQESIADRFIERVVERSKRIKLDHRLDPETMVGTHASRDQHEKILNYIQIGRDEGAEVLIGGAAHTHSDGLEEGFYVQPTLIKGHNKMRVFQEEIFGWVASVATFKDQAEAIEIANDTLYGLGAGVWTRDEHQLYHVPRAIKAGRVWVNCYHNYPAHAPFGSYKKSGFGRENHKMMLDHYRNNKNMLISYDKKAVGFLKAKKRKG